MEGKPKMDFNKNMIAFGAYALVYTDTSNNNTPRTVPAVALRMSNNAGGHYFMSLHSGKRIHGYKWTELSIDKHVIERVEQLAAKEDQPIMHRRMPCFEWAPGIEIEDIDEEEERVLAIANKFDEPNASEQIDMEPYHEEDDAQPIQENQEIAPIENEILEENIPIPNNDDGLIIVPEDNIVSEEEDIIEPNDEIDEGSDIASENASIAEEVIVADVDDNPEEPMVTEHGRPRRVNAGSGVERIQMDFHGKGYGAKREFTFVTNGKIEKAQKDDTEQYTYMQMACNVIFTQMSANSGFKNMVNQLWLQ